MASRKEILASALFAPRSVALVGASSDPGKNSSRAQRLLKMHGYRGRVLPINPGHREIQGVTAYPDLRSAPGPIDHALIMVAQRYVEDALRQCAELGIPAATILSDGYAETGEQGKKKEQALREIARTSGIRLIGPNTVGLFDLHSGAALSMNVLMEAEPFIPGNLAVISHSGGVLGSILGRGHVRGIGFSKLVGLGNECDITVGELVDLLVDDPVTSAILLFLETVRDPDTLAKAARRAFEAGKPVIAYMLGRSAIGRKLAHSHTGAMAGSRECIDAYLRHNGILRVSAMETLLELPTFVRGHKPAGRARVAALTGSGGTAATVVDRLGELGIDVVPPSPEVIARLAAEGITISDALLTDTTMGSARTGFQTILSALMTSDHCDAVLAVASPRAYYDPTQVVNPIVDVQPRGKPLAVFIGPPAETAHRLLEKAGIASFRAPETCADAIRAYCDWRAPATAVAVDGQSVARVETMLTARGDKSMNEEEAYAVFRALGIPCAASQVLRDPALPCTLAYPVAAKILSADITHKTDVGGVALGITGPEALRIAATGLIEQVRTARPDACIDGVLVQSMEQGLAEAILGFKHDPVVGPIVVLGAGGILTEIYHDYAVRLAPVSVADAREMIAEVRGLVRIRGFRGAPPGDADSLAHAVHAMSLLACLPNLPVAEAEINPLIIKEQGVVAVDGLLILRGTTGR